MELQMVDPQEFGEIRANVKILLDNDKAKTTLLASLAESLQAIELQLAEAKGGWKLLMAAGTAAGSVGAGIGWVVHEIMLRIK